MTSKGLEVENLLEGVSHHRLASRLAEEAESFHPVMAISHAIVSAKSLPEIAESVRTKVLEFLSADLGGLLLIDPESGEIHGFPEAAEEASLRNRLLTMAGKLAVRGESEVAPLEDGNDPSLLGICPCPLQRGASEVLYARFRGPLTEEQQHAAHLRLVSVARLIGVAIERIRQATLMTALVKAGEGLLVASTEPEICSVVAEQMPESFDCSAFYLSLYNPVTERLRCILYSFFGEDITAKIPVLDLKGLAANESWTAQVMRANHELEIPDSSASDLPARPIPVEGVVAGAYFGVPLHDDHGLRLGVLSIQSAAPRRFSSFTKQALRTLAILVAPALNRAIRSQAVERRQLAVQRVGDLMDRGLLVQRIEKELQPVWEDRELHVHLLLADRGERKLTDAADPSAPAIAFGSGLVGRVAESGEPILAQNESAVGPALLLRPETKSALCLPVQLGDSLLGILALETPEPDLFILQEDLPFLESIARSVATTLVAAGRKESAEAVIQASKEAAGHPDDGIRILTRSAHDIVSSLGGTPTSTTVFLLTGRILELVASWPEELFDDLYRHVGKLPLEVPTGQKRGFVAIAADERRPQYVADVKKEKDRYLPYSGRTQAELAVPMLAANGRAIGVLNLEFENLDPLSSEQQDLVRNLANQAAIVATLQRQSRDLHLAKEQKKRTTMVVLGIDIAHGRHTLINELEGVIKKADHGLILVKEMRRLWARLLHRWRRKTSDSELKELRSAFQFVKTQLEALRAQSRSEIFEQKTHLPVNSLLLKLGDRHSAVHSSIDLRLELGAAEADTVDVNEIWLTRAIDNLVRNAFRAAETNATVQSPCVVLRSSRLGETIFIEIEDSGPGISPDVRALLFDSIIPQDLRTSGGNGTGCFLTSAILEMYNGRVSLAPAGNHGSVGTTVVVELPSASPLPSARAVI